MNREYVIVCNEHRAMWNGCLLFWGHKTEDKKKRSFGGYTSDIDKCERYTLDEIRNKGYPFVEFNNDMDWQEFRKCDDIIIKESDLEKLGYKIMKVYYMP